MEVVAFIETLLASTVRLATPIVLAAVGATVCERAGIVNIAMEGIMTVGAFAAATAAYFTGSPWVGLLVGVAAGGLFSLIHGASTISLHMDHVVSGAVINILAFGLVRYLMYQFYGHPGTSEQIATSLNAYRFAVPGLSKIPLIGKALFNQTPIVYMTFLTVILLAVYLKRTKTGLHIRAAGEHPMALETIGVSVKKMRYLAILISGFTSGLAGAFLSIEQNASFTEGMVNGRGFIALAANISGGWTALGSFLAGLFFGFAEALQIKVQVLSLRSIPPELFIIFPYVATILAVAGLVRRSRPPKASGLDFIIEKEE